MRSSSLLGRVIGMVVGVAVLAGFALVLSSILVFIVPLFILLFVVFAFQAFMVRRKYGPAVQAARDTFRETAFTLMGCVAKSDGRISENEIAVTEQLMTRLGLRVEQRREAIALFKRGAEPGFAIDAQLDAFVRDCGKFFNLRQMLLLFLFTTAAADGALAPAEHELLRRIAARIGFSEAALDQLLRMFAAQVAFSQAGTGAAPRANALAEAYTALGVDAEADDRTVKQAYRRLMSQYHPDKLIAEGMPEDMVRMATERTQEIQNAWELIRKSRGL